MRLELLNRKLGDLLIGKHYGKEVLFFGVRNDMGHPGDLLHFFGKPLGQASGDDELCALMGFGELPDLQSAAAIGRFGDGAGVHDAKVSLLLARRFRIAHRPQLIGVGLGLILVRAAPEGDDLKFFLVG